jgi:hypothetical protein
MVLVDQPTEDLVTLDRLGPRGPRAWDRPADIVRTTKTEPAMGSMRVVVREVLTQHVHQVHSVKDQHVIEDLPPQTSDQSLDVAVACGVLYGVSTTSMPSAAKTASKRRQ